MGYGYIVATDNWYSSPALRLWRFDSDPIGPGTVVYRDPSWASAAMEHVSHLNGRPGAAGPQYACGSGASRTPGPRVGEISCFRLDGSQRVLVVAPVMTDLNAAGGGDDYGKLPKGNLDSTGGFFIWTTNLGGARLDAFIVRVPASHPSFQPASGEAPAPPRNVRILQ
jgi:hypothetical protein